MRKELREALDEILDGATLSDLIWIVARLSQRFPRLFGLVEAKIGERHAAALMIKTDKGALEDIDKGLKSSGKIISDLDAQIDDTEKNESKKMAGARERVFIFHLSENQKIRESERLGTEKAGLGRTFSRPQ